jgi:hypothetical protein
MLDIRAGITLLLLQFSQQRSSDTGSALCDSRASLITLLHKEHLMLHLKNRLSSREYFCFITNAM